MVKRGIEPEEAIGPVVNGLENFPIFTPREEAHPLPEFEESLVEAEPEEFEDIEDPILLLCGDGETAHETARLAIQCGFILEIFTDGSEEDAALNWPEAAAVHSTPDWADIEEICHVDRNYYVCVFLDNLQDCKDIISRLLPSEARYLGVFGDWETRQEIFDGLRRMGAPDAELVAIACPMGLNIGAVTPIQQSVSITAELLAVKAGTLKRLIHGEDKRKNRSRAGGSNI